MTALMNSAANTASYTNTNTNENTFNTNSECYGSKPKIIKPSTLLVCTEQVDLLVHYTCEAMHSEVPAFPKMTLKPGKGIVTSIGVC